MKLASGWVWREPNSPGDVQNPQKWAFWSYPIAFYCRVALKTLKVCSKKEPHKKTLWHGIADLHPQPQMPLSVSKGANKSFLSSWRQGPELFFFSKGTFIGLEAFQALALDGQFRRALRLLRRFFFLGVSCESLEGDICGEKPLWVCYVPFSMWNFGWIKSWLWFLMIHRQYIMKVTLGRSRCFTCWLRKGRKGKAFRGHFFVILVIAFWS